MVLLSTHTRTKLETPITRCPETALRKNKTAPVRRGHAGTWLLLLYLMTALAARAALKPETKDAYQAYIAAQETRLELQNRMPSGFLWIDRASSRTRSVQSGSIVAEEVASFAVPGGMVQHWIGGVFLPRATLRRVEQVDQDYANYATIYSPDITRPKVLEHQGDHFLVSYRIRKKKILTAVMDTEHAIDYAPLGPGRMAIRSRSEYVRQVQDPDTPTERILADGEGDGFLWAMNSYWRMEERDGGVYLECEAITLSRDVPFAMRRMLAPILRSFAQESLQSALAAKRRAVTAIVDAR
jgi:hypothetical protein